MTQSSLCYQCKLSNYLAGILFDYQDVSVIYIEKFFDIEKDPYEIFIDICKKK